MTWTPPEPRCVGPCQKLAADLTYLDGHWSEARVEVEMADEDERRRQRVEYARTDGTYNKATGSFWCDPCYVAVGMPLGVAP